MTRKAKATLRPTPRQLSRWQQERSRQRLIFFFGLAAIVLIVGVLGYGYYDSQIAIRWQAVARVDDTVFNLSYYVKVLRAYLGGQKNQDTARAMAAVIVNRIQDDELIRREASRLSLAVSAGEVDQEIRKGMNPEDKTLEEAEFQKLYTQRLSQLGLSDADFREMVRTSLLWVKVQDHLAAQVPDEAEQVHLLAIKLDSQEKAQEVRSRLEAGGDFAALAQELSTDESTKAKGGDMGWLPRGIYPELDETAFSLQPGTLSQVVATPAGEFYLLKVAEKAAKRPVDEDNRNVLKSMAFRDLLEQKRKASRLESYLDDRKLDWAIKQMLP